MRMFNFGNNIGGDAMSAYSPKAQDNYNVCQTYLGRPYSFKNFLPRLISEVLIIMIVIVTQFCIQGCIFSDIAVINKGPF